MDNLMCSIELIHSNLHTEIRVTNETHNINKTKKNYHYPAPTNKFPPKLIKTVTDTS